MSGRVHDEPSVSVHDWIVFHDDLSDKAVRVFLAIRTHGRVKEYAFPSRQRLADLLRCSIDTIDRALRELEQVGALVVDKRPRPGGGRPIAHYWLWPATPDQVRKSAVLQVRKNAAASPQKCGDQVRKNAESDDGHLFIEQVEGNSKKRTSADKPPPAGPDPLHEHAHKLTVLAFEQPVKPVIPHKDNPFEAVFSMIRRELHAGRSVNDLRRAIEAGVDVWTTNGLRTSIARTRSTARAGVQEGDEAARRYVERLRGRTGNGT